MADPTGGKECVHQHSRPYPPKLLPICVRNEDELWLPHTTAPLPNVQAKRVEMDMNEDIIVPRESVAGKRRSVAEEERRTRPNRSAMLSKNEPRMKLKRRQGPRRHGGLGHLGPKRPKQQHEGVFFFHICTFRSALAIRTFRNVILFNLNYETRYTSKRCNKCVIVLHIICNPPRETILRQPL